MKDFFISYNKADFSWAEWIGWVLEEAGYAVDLQAWDFTPGGNFILEMDRASKESRHTLAVLSPDYLNALYTQPEWAAAFARDPTGKDHALIPVRVRECELSGLLAQCIYVDLVGQEESAAKAKLLAAATGERGKPTSAPRFPGGRRIRERVGFPGAINPDSTAVPSPAASPLCQLSPPVADFTGREKELDKLRSAVASGGAMISGVRGMGGVGKTELARKLAEQLAPRFPDAQFFFDLRGTDPDRLSPRTSVEAMSHVLWSIHREWTLPEQPEAVRALYLAELNGRRALLLMDNALDAKQVAPLIPPPGCLLLVTSRQHFTLPGLAFVDLEELPPDKSRELLLTICPRIAGHADDIAKQCGYLPLALRIAGSFLTERPDFPPHDYLTRLRKERLKQLDGVEASIALSDALLTDELRPRFHALSVFPGDFDRPAAAAVWECADDAALDALSTLHRFSLLQWSETTDRYRLHDLVRLYADKRLSPSDRESLGLRHVEHYLRVAGRTSELYKAGGEDRFKGLALFGIEFNNIQKGFEFLAAMPPENISCRRLVVQYPDACSYCLFVRLPSQHLLWLQTALQAAQQLNNLPAQAAHYGNLGLIHQTRGDLDQAQTMHKKSLEIEEKLGRLEGMASDYGNLGVIHRKREDLDQAETLLKKALEIEEKLGRLEGMANAYGNLGNVYFTRGDLDQAETILKKALEIFEKFGALEQQATVLGNLGLIHKNRGDLDQAEIIHKKALEIDQKLGRHQGMAAHYGNLGSVAKQRGNLVEARRLWTQARDLYANIGMPHMVRQLQSWLDGLPTNQSRER